MGKGKKLKKKRKKWGGSEGVKKKKKFGKEKMEVRNKILSNKLNLMHS